MKCQRAKSAEYKNDWNNFNPTKMHSDNEEKMYCEYDGEYTIFCHLCDKLAIDRYFKNNVKWQTHINRFRRRREMNKTTSTSQIQINHPIF